MGFNLKYNNRLFSAVYALISLFPFCFDMAVVDAEKMKGYSGRFNIIFNELRLSLDGNDIHICILFICLLLFYNKCLSSNMLRINIPLMVMSIFYAIIMILGESFYVTGTWKEVFECTSAQKIKAVLVFAGNSIIIYFVLFELVRIMEKKRKRKKEGKICVYSKKGVINTWLIVFICWFPYILIKYPGILAWDSATVLKSYFDHGKEINNGVPAFVSILLIWTIKLGRWIKNDNIGLFIWGIFQSLSLSFVISFFICFLENLGTLKVYRYLLLVFYAFMPLFPFTGMKTGSDTLYTMAIMIYVVFLISYCDDRCISKLKIALVVLDMFLVELTRHTGIYIIVICMVIGILIQRREEKKKRFIAMHLVAILLYVSWTIFILPNVTTNNILNTSGSLLGISRQQIANTIVAGVSTEEERLLGQFIDTDLVLEKYNPELIDPITSIVKQDMSITETKEYVLLWIKLGIKYPKEYLQAVLNMWYGYFYPDYVCKTKNYMAYKIDNIADSENVNIGYVNGNGYWRELLDSWWMFLYKCPVIGTMYGCGIYTCILIFCIGYMIMRKRYHYFMAFLPIIFSLGVCMLSPVCGTVRYAFPIIFNIPILGGLFCTFDREENLYG